jgi:16S rRNA (cytidine1402-2'-O)-methyltransferase
MNRRSKRQDLPTNISSTLREGVLQVVATPIGNLQDVSSRVRQSLTDADIILAEDTRRTLQLLQALQISGRKIERLDIHEEYRSVSYWVGELAAGKRLALVSDAGTPGVSDPGALLVQEALERGIRVEPIPGPSAVSAFVSISGFAGETAFGFLGFFPRAERERLALWRELLSSRGACRVWFFFESPERIESSLVWLSEHTEGQVFQVRAVKELTKLHEKVFAGDLTEVLECVRSELQAEGARGEWCFAIRIKTIDEKKLVPTAETEEFSRTGPEWHEVLQAFSEVGAKDSDAAKWISKLWKVDRKTVYDRILQAKRKKESGVAE